MDSTVQAPPTLTLPLKGGGNYYWIVPLVFLINFIVYYLTAAPLLDDSDVPWHLATGRLLLETYRVPTTDPWSFASNGHPWYLLSWIWDALLGVTERVGGLSGVLIFTIALSAAIPALIARHLLRIGVALPAVFFTVMLASLGIMDFITARPHLSGYVMALVFYMILHKSRPLTPSPLRGEGWGGGDALTLPSARRSPPASLPPQGGGIIILPLLMLIWANMHGSFIAGFSILGAFIIEAYATTQAAWLKRLLMISVACALCAAINPYGLDVILGAMQSLRGSAEQYNLEWYPFSFSVSTGVSAWLIVFILAGNLRGSRAALADKILAIGWMLGTFFAMRNAPIFIILSAPYLAVCLDEATAKLRQTRAPSTFMMFMQRQPIRRIWCASIAAFALFIAVAMHNAPQEKIASPERSVSDAIDFALEHYPHHRYLTDYNFGGQVIYRTYGALPFFMDSRAGTVYSDAAMKDYLEFLWQNDGWEARMRKYRINAIMIGKSSVFAKTYENATSGNPLQKHWQLVFAGKRANVYIARP